MALDRYESDAVIQGGKILGTNRSILLIRQATKSGKLSVAEKVTTSFDRLDNIAAQVYGDGRLWWVIAAASEIGWWLQIPPGTLLKIPINLGEIEEML